MKSTADNLREYSKKKKKKNRVTLCTLHFSFSSLFIDSSHGKTFNFHEPREKKKRIQVLANILGRLYKSYNALDSFVFFVVYFGLFALKTRVFRRLHYIFFSFLLLLLGLWISDRECSIFIAVIHSVWAP